MFSGIYSFIKKKPFLTVLIIICISISILNLKPYFHLVGWDNYSSYLDLPINIFRTFFATWRDYRGLGSPSDSEVTDLFRQFFSLILSIVFRKTFIDQVYYLVTINLGIFSMYALARKIALAIFKTYKEDTISLDLFAFTAAFFYLFNLNTLSVFYFPILPYISRFFGIPLTFLILTELLDKKFKSPFRVLLLIAALFFTTTSYVTATVFITIVMVVGMFGIVRKDIGRVVVVILFWGLLQSFWTFPFLNYTLQKSSIIRLARTFIDANETQLNRPKSFYSLADQLILKPNFFDTKYSSLDGNISRSFYPLSDELQGKSFAHYLQYMFPLLMLLGGICIVIRPRKYRNLLWVPLTFSLFLFLSMKEYSPLGFLYAYINEHVPLFGVLFRFGDTKFHPFIAFAGGISAAVSLTSLYNIAKDKIPHWSKIAVVTGAIFIFLPVLLTYRTYFQGNLVGFFMYTKIPDAYFKIAQTINKDPTDGRVIHLPYDQSMYWKSHNWGYLGSSFFNFMISKPYLDKTFEPGSMENAYSMKRIADLVSDAKDLTGIRFVQKSVDIRNLLSRMGVSYILYDETVSAQSPARGVSFWGTYDTFTAQEVIKVLEDARLIQKVQTENISLKDYLGLYKKLLPTDQTQMEKLLQSDPKKLVLYKLDYSAPRFKTLSQVTNTDHQIANLLETDLIGRGEDLIQQKGVGNKVYFPLNTSSLPIESEKNIFTVRTTAGEPGRISNISISGESRTDSETRMVHIRVKRLADTLFVSLFSRYYPNINGQEYLLPLDTFEIPIDDFRDDLLPVDIDSYVSDWHVLPMKSVSALRIRIGDTVLPLPSPLSDTFLPLGDVMTRGGSFELEVLSPRPRLPINPQIFNLTDRPNCLGDAREDYVSNLTTTPQNAVISTQNGSVCVWTDIGQNTNKDSSYAELQLSIENSTSDLDGDYGLNYADTSKPLLKRVITRLSKPSNLKVCIKEGVLDQCYNNHHIVTLQESNKFIFPVHSPDGNFYNPVALFTLFNVGHHSQRLDMHDLSLTYFNSVFKESVVIPILEAPVGTLAIRDGIVQITIPKALSKYAYFLKPGTDGYYISTGKCDKDNSYRTYRISGENMISYFDNCSNTLTQKVAFSSDNFLMWNVRYNLLSGRYPQMKISDSYATLSEDIASLYQGYPDVPGFGDFANPEMFFDTNDTIVKKLGNLVTRDTYGFVHPHPGKFNQKDKEFTLQQYGENEGILMINGFTVADLPTSWSNLRISHGDPVKSYETPKQISFAQILPSLWKIELVRNPTDTNYLLEFNTGYDAQWGIYDSIGSVLIGKSIATNHSRCNGYSNCFELPANWTENKKTFYVFYWPERLAALGWIVTLVTAIAGMYLFSRRSHNK